MKIIIHIATLTTQDGHTKALSMPISRRHNILTHASLGGGANPPFQNPEDGPDLFVFYYTTDNFFLVKLKETWHQIKHDSARIDRRMLGV